MKLRKVLAGGIVIGVGIMSSVQLFATTTIAEEYKSNIIYTINDDTKVTSMDSDYKELFFKVLGDYLSVDTSKFPADATFTVLVEDRKTIIENDEKILLQQKKAYEENKIPEAVYKQTLADIENHKEDTYDIVHCTLSFPTTNKVESETSSETLEPAYKINFNADTKEILFLDAPLSDDGTEILVKETPIKFSIKDLEEKYATLIKTYKIGGIQNPICITDQIEGTNQQGGIPVLIYQEQDDANKKVTIALDSANGGINYIFVW